jgi:hypothetical protein
MFSASMITVTPQVPPTQQADIASIACACRKNLPITEMELV